MRVQEHEVIQIYCIYLRISRSRVPPKYRVRMWSKIIDPRISRGWFLRTCTGCKLRSTEAYYNRTLSPGATRRKLLFCRLEKNSLFYDPRISRSLNFYVKILS